MLLSRGRKNPSWASYRTPHKSSLISSKASCKTCEHRTICCVHLFRRRCHSVIHLGHRCSAWQSETRTTYSMHENVPTFLPCHRRPTAHLSPSLPRSSPRLTSCLDCRQVFRFVALFSSFNECLPLFPDLDCPSFSISKPDQKFSVTCRSLHAGSDRQTDGRKEGRHDAIRKAMDKLFCVCPFRI